MLELWRYTYSYQGRWYEAYCYLILGETVESAHRRIALSLVPQVTGLQVRRVGHVSSIAGCGPSKRIPKSYAIQSR